MISHVFRHAFARPLFIATLASLSATGCALDAHHDDAEAQGDEHLATASSALTFTGSWAWGGIGGNHAVLGVANVESCFLTSVGGNLTSSWGNGSPWGQPAFIKVGPNGAGNNEITVQAGNTYPFVTAGTSCVTRSTRSATIPAAYFTTGIPRQPIAPVTPNRRCFITGVLNATVVTQLTPQSFAAPGDVLRVYADGGQWYIDGTGNVAGYASCIDVTQVLSVGAWVNDRAMSLNMGVNTPGMQCYLTAIGGAFKTDDTSGVSTSYVPIHSRWELNVSAGKTGAAECSR